jgi:hypothetical protein
LKALDKQLEEFERLETEKKDKMAVTRSQHRELFDRFQRLQAKEDEQVKKQLEFNQKIFDNVQLKKEQERRKQELEEITK